MRTLLLCLGLSGLVVAVFALPWLLLIRWLVP